MRVGGFCERLRRLAGHRRRAVATGLLLAAAAALATTGNDTSQPPHEQRESGLHTNAAGTVHDAAEREHRGARWVTAPVRIADAATARLLRPGDRVDVVASGASAPGGGSRVVAHGARVTRVPELPDGTAGLGALVLLAVPRADAAVLVGAGTTARLAVTLC